VRILNPHPYYFATASKITSTELTRQVGHNVNPLRIYPPQASRDFRENAFVPPAK